LAHDRGQLAIQDVDHRLDRPLTTARSRSRNATVSAAGARAVTRETSRSANIGPRRHMSCAFPGWQAVHVRLSDSMARFNVSLFRIPRESTVSTIAVQPARSARRTIPVVTAQSSVG
jgi:hypothetical protein